MTATEFADVVVPQQPAANDDQRALLEWAAANPTDRPTPDRAANGRYKLPHPETGKAQTWTRATTYAGTIDDAAGLTTWRNRLLVAGILGNVDEFTGTKLDDKAALSTVAGRALHLAGEKLAADVGTALHTATEHRDMGTGKAPPAPWAADVEARALLLERHGLTAPAEWVERIVVCPELGIAGTIDRILRGSDSALYIEDDKTGSGADRLSYAVQLAIYAHSPWMWKLDGSGYEPTPAVDQDVAYIVHMPAGTGTAQLIEVDIAAGWELVQLCGQVRDARKTKGLFRTLVADTTERDLAASLIEDRTAWLLERVAALKADNPEMVPMAGERWRATGIAVQPPWTDAEITTISEVLHGVEQTWASNDPATPPPPALTIGQDPPLPPALWTITDDGALASSEDVDGLRAVIKGLSESDHKIAMLTHWAKQGRSQERPWDSTEGMTVRCWTIARAAVRTLTCIGADDQRLRMALAYVTGDDLHEAWATGAALGSLTTAQADELAAVANAYRAKDATVRAVIDGAAT